MAKPAIEPLPPLHRPSPLSGSPPKQRQAAAPVLATHLAKHLDLSRQRIQQLVDEQVIAPLPGSGGRRFDQSDCRIKYIRWLRAPERRTARSKVDADFIKAKTELIAIRVREKKRDLIELEYAKEIQDKTAAVVLTAMAGMAARIGGSDLQLRRKVDQIVYETRVQLANIFNELADEAGEPPLTQAPTTDSTEEDG